MGCCYSHEDEDDRRVPSARPAYEIRRPAPAFTPTVSISRSNYDPYRNQFKAVAPPAPPSFRSVPVQNRVPTPQVRPAPAVVIKPIQEFKPRPGALYGEYKCVCGYFWVSRLSWRDKYQQCKRCRKDVRPRNQRELRPSDFNDKAEGLEHPQHLCEMCKQVGGYCGKYK